MRRELQKLKEAVFNNDLANCQRIVANCGHGIITTTDDGYGYAAIHYAVIYSRTALLEWFLQQPINCNVSDSDGFTALMLAANKGRLACAQLLVQAGANTAKKRQGMTALDLARARLSFEIVALLEEHERLLEAQQGIKPALRTPAIAVEAVQYEQEAETQPANLLAAEIEQLSTFGEAFDSDGARTHPREIAQEEAESTQLRPRATTSERSLEQIQRSEAPAPAMDLSLTDLDFDQRE
eukprot:m.175693 g.175693  ORF g.175693 m.175693 type:complete len:239 (+) comp53325_c0_seq5:94-810(+)